MASSLTSGNNCSICLGPAGEEYTDNEGNKYVTVTLHTQNEVEHKVHRICVFEWFQSQLADEPRGIVPNDFTQVPFSCMLCREKITTEQAAAASGLTLEAFKGFIETNRRNRPQVEPDLQQFLLRGQQALEQLLAAFSEQREQIRNEEEAQRDDFRERFRRIPSNREEAPANREEVENNIIAVIMREAFSRGVADEEEAPGCPIQ